MQSTTDSDDAHQTGPAATEKSKPQPSTSDTEAGPDTTKTRRTGTSTPLLNESHQSPSTAELPSQEFDVIIRKALQVRAAGSTCKAAKAELRKLQEFEQEARTSKEKSNGMSHTDNNRQHRTTATKPVEKKDSLPRSTAPQNTEETTMDPLDLAKIVESRLKDSDASPVRKQDPTLNFLATNKDSQKNAEYEAKTLAPLDLAKIVEARLQDSGDLSQSENTATPKGANSQVANSHPPAPTSNANQRPGAYSGAPGTDLQRANTLRFSLVGATANQPMISQASLPSVHEEEGLQVTEDPKKEYIPTESNRGLAVANLVDEDDDIAPENLPQAKSADNAIAQSEAQHQESIKQVKIYLLLGIIFILAVALILIVTLSVRNKPGETVMPTPSQTPIPTSVPTSYSEYWLSVFPESTVSTILEDLGSPQSMAFGWLMEEIDILRNLTEGRVLQRFVLATFYFANSKERWSFSDNWLNHSVHECLWYSSLEHWYFESEANFVLSLDLINPCEQDLAGYLEDGILHQGDGIIRHLWLSFNGLMGSGIPPELYLLTELKSLALDELNLTSTIPEELSGLSNLEYLSMISCDLYGSVPEALGSLSKLLAVYFAFNSLTGTIPSSLYSMMSSMRSIILTYNQLTGPVPTELGLLTNLQSLTLDTNLFTGTIPTELGRLTLLEALLLNDLILRGSIPNELAVLTDTLVLQLDNSGLTGMIPRWLGNMTSLEGLTISENSFNGTIPTELGLLTKMRTFWLDVNALSGTIPSELGMYEQVGVLTMSGNSLTGTIPTELGLLTELIQLWLQDNELTGTVPLELGNVPFPAPYGEVWLHGNDLSGVIPESLCSANNLTFDCGTMLCGCGWCNCSSMSMLEVENQHANGQLLVEENQTST